MKVARNVLKRAKLCVNAIGGLLTWHLTENNIQEKVINKSFYVLIAINQV